MQRGVSNLGVRVLQVFDQHWNHRGDFRSIVNVFANLREGHDASVLVPPVHIVGDRVGHELTHKREHKLLAEAVNEPVDTILSELDIVIVLLDREAFTRGHPLLVDLLGDIDHDFEDGLQKVLQRLHVLLYDRRKVCNQSHDEFNRLVPDCWFVKVGLGCDLFETSKQLLELGLEKGGLGLGQLIELDEGVFEHSLVPFDHGLINHVGHEGEQQLEGLAFLAVSDAQVGAGGLEGGQLDIEGRVVKGLLEYLAKVLSVGLEMLRNVREESCEDFEARVDL